MTRYTQTVKTAAADLYIGWRHDATPRLATLITADEAWRLTDGTVGVEGSPDYMRLIDVALAYAQARHDARDLAKWPCRRGPGCANHATAV